MVHIKHSREVLELHHGLLRGNSEWGYTIAGKSQIFLLQREPFIGFQALDKFLDMVKQFILSGVLDMLLESHHFFNYRRIVPLIKNKRQGRIPAIVTAIPVRQHFP